MHSHDHQLCMTEAEALCAKAGESLTPLRRRVLELLLDAPGPAKAYDLLTQLGDDSGAAKPPTIYRALEFLLQVGLAHKIESLNAFVACSDPHDHGTHAHGVTAFAICEDCGAVSEFHDDVIETRLTAWQKTQHFKPEKTTIEIRGHCRACS